MSERTINRQSGKEVKTSSLFVCLRLVYEPMEKLIFSICLLISMLGLLAEAQTCPARCVNVSGQPVNDNVCSTVGHGGNKAGCEAYQALGCQWQQPQPTPFGGFCLSTQPANNQFCDTMGQSQGAQGCNTYSNLGCHWVKTQGLCN